MRIDQQGVAHPTPSDFPETEGLLHIADCAECQATFSETVVSWARGIKESLGS